MKTEFNSPLTPFSQLKSSLKLTPEPQRFPGTWFISKAKLSNQKTHLVVTLVPSEGSPFQGTKERVSLLFPPDTPPMLVGSEIDDPEFSAYVIGFDDAKNPLYARPTLAERPKDREPTRNPDGEIIDLGHCIYHAAYLEGLSAKRTPGSTGKAKRGAALLADLAAAPAPEADRPPLTEADLG